MYFRSISCIRYFRKNAVYFSQRYSTPVKSIFYEPLEHRCLLQLSGPDTNKFLQGMVTNDMQVFSENYESDKETPCIYAMLLNPHGRVLYDILLYRVNENEYLLEYDGFASNFIKTHLDMYKLRKNVNIQHVKDKSIWSAYIWPEFASEEDSALLCENVSTLKNIEGVISAQDPRLKELGCRFIVPNSLGVEKHLQHHLPNSESNVSYNLLRYKLGIGEGVKDHPPGNCLPFEANIDILNGVSFSKGCYVGQETVSKIHYTGVIRMRLMPVKLLPEQESYPLFEPECRVVNDKGQRIGKFRSNIGKHGLAVLNTIEAMKYPTLSLKGYDYQIVPIMPKWWPPYANNTSN